MIATMTEVAVERLDVSAFTVPTDPPESDGTFEWDSTTIVVVEAHAGDRVGLGYTYTHDAAARLIEDKLAAEVVGRDVFAIREAWEAMARALRNVGRPGLGFMALSAVDLALWDLQARLLDQPLVSLLDLRRQQVPVYGSGGFCSYSDERLRRQLGGWVENGIPRVKMKLGREPARDPTRLDAAREAVGEATELYVDANGAFERKEALTWAERYARDWGVTWFEEPVSSADLEGLRLLREEGPTDLDIAAGEYAFVPADFHNLLAARAVDCLQIDVTRAGGTTGFLRAAALAESFGVDVSAHCAPQASLAACCAAPRFRHLEYFHDHVRLERMLFDGVLDPVGGALQPDRSRPGNGLELRRADAEEYAA